LHYGQQLALIKNPFHRGGAEARRKSTADVLVRMTGLKGIARGGIFEAVGSSPEKGVERFADPRRLDDYRDTKTSALFSIGRDSQNYCK
jgi:hypothetical protein